MENFHTCITSRECYDYYRKNRKKVAKSIDQYNYFVKSLKSMFDIVALMVKEQDGGVYLEEFGYFANVLKIGEKKVRYYKKPSYLRYYFSEFGNKVFKDWYMQNTFEKEVALKNFTRRRNRKNLRYKLHYTYLEILIKALSESRKEINYKKAHK